MNKKITAALAAAVLLLAGCSKIKTDIPARPDQGSSAPASQGSPEIPAKPGSSSVPQAGTEPSSDPVSDPVPEPVPEQPETVYDEAVYKEILDELWLLTGGYIEPEFEGAMGVWETAQALGDDAFEGIGYTLKDVSGDGSPELLVGAVDGGEASSGSMLYAVYTLTEEGPYCALSGWYRNAYYLTDNGFFFSGSSGAAYTIFGRYILSGDGRIPICTDYYFTKEKDETFEEIGFYHNTTGHWDPDASEEFGEEAFWAEHDRMAEEIRSAGLTPFAEYGFTGEIPEPAPAEPETVPTAEAEIRDARDQLEYYEQFESFAAENTEYSTDVLITAAGGPIRDLAVLALEFTDIIGEDVLFTFEELYRLDELTPECPLLLRVSFPGSIPLYGISYAGADGETVYRSLNMSGMDGSYYLSPFTPAE
ncbi:MAG: hypothetical protein IKM31_07265 [Oscillospiraceae bacterium]|nr:hypothetical protein [Oscillospiraceae bacterium]